MVDVVVYGTGPTSRLLHAYLSVDSTHRVVAFAEPDAGRVPTAVAAGVPSLHVDALLERFPPSVCRMLVALEPQGLNTHRERGFEHALELGYELISYVSSGATVAAEVPVGANCVILEGTVVQPFAVLRDDVFIEPGCHVGHESVIEAHAYLAARTVVSGNVSIGQRCSLGPNATVRNDVSLAPDTRVGPGAAVLKSTTSMHEYLAAAPTRFDSDEADVGEVETAA